MCGIYGIWNFDGAPVDSVTLGTMGDSLRHRGPDDEGSYLSGPVGLGHRRLSIIDLDTGRQPISSEDGTIWITYNGEVYNFPELRSELVAKGHSFSTRTDTEVVVHLYEELGPRCVDRLRGMFAFAIWDTRRRQMMLARDRLGQKPLYYLCDGRRLIFGSELKAVLIPNGVERELDLAGLEAYLTLDYIPAPLTIYQGIRKLPAAHLLVCREGRVEIERYWKPDIVKSSSNNHRSTVEDYAEELLELLRESVRIRMVSDVPLGVLLSGGVDSSTVVAMMSQLTDQPIKTFSIGSPHPDFDELPYARMVADRFGTEHHEFVVEPDALEVLPELLRAYDEPFADSSAIPTYYVSQLASMNVSVALAGDGGDELFAGYPWYSSLRDESWVTRLPDGPRRAMFALPYLVWPSSWRGKGRLNMWRQPDAASRYSARRNRFPPRERQRLLSPDLQKHMADVEHCNVVARAAGEALSADRVAMMQYADLMTYLPEDLLVKVDRASMWHSLEVRAPFLDHKLVEFALTIPTELKLVNGDAKHILKQVIGEWVPHEALYRPKMGFGIPLSHWLRGNMLGFAREVLLDGPTRRRGHFRSEYISDLLERHRSGRSNPTVTTHQIWSLLYLELWFREFVDKAPLANTAGRPAYGVHWLAS